MSVAEFLEIVSDLTCIKSSGVDNINSKLIIDGMRAIPEVFTKVCNKSLQSGIFPETC